MPAEEVEAQKAREPRQETCQGSEVQTLVEAGRIELTASRLKEPEM